jgi:hypothetical protein
LHGGAHPIRPFHWEVEFPEVFSGDNPGFHALVGNPPFSGVTALSENNPPNYTDWLRYLCPESGGKCDLVAFFFRRSFELIMRKGAFGLVATNTIRQGDTRRSGLTYLLKHDAVIFSAVRRRQWPGAAAVVVSVVHIAKGQRRPPFELDGRTVRRISAYLLESDLDNDPLPIVASSSLAFLGSKTQGIGFVFDDDNSACPGLFLQDEAIRKNPRCASRIKPYIGGQELNSDTEHLRQVIDLGELSEPEARKQYAELMAILEKYVRPERAHRKGALAQRWWVFGHRAVELYNAISSLRRVLAVSEIGNYCAFDFLPTGMVYANTLVVFALSEYSSFAVLQSRIHHTWALTFGSSMKDDLRYNPSDCFDTYPMPVGWRSNVGLERVGRKYHEFRVNLMLRNKEGLTDTYNRFHGRTNHDSDIQELRELHDAMDCAVLEAYGWTDLKPRCEFVLDYERDADSEENRSKKPWRYRWPDEIRDEVLARLLALNAHRAEEERLAGTTAKDGKAKSKGPARRTKRIAAAQASFQAVKSEE